MLRSLAVFVCAVGAMLRGVDGWSYGAPQCFIAPDPKNPRGHGANWENPKDPRIMGVFKIDVIGLTPDGCYKMGDKLHVRLWVAEPGHTWKGFVMRAEAVDIKAEREKPNFMGQFQIKKQAVKLKTSCNNQVLANLIASKIARSSATLLVCASPLTRTDQASPAALVPKAMPEPAASMDLRFSDVEKMAEVMQRQHIENVAFLTYCTAQYIAREGVCSGVYNRLIFFLQCYFMYCTTVCVFGANLFKALCGYFSFWVVTRNQQEGMGFWMQMQQGLQLSPQLRWLLDGLDPVVLCQRLLMSESAMGICAAVVRFWRAPEESGGVGRGEEDGAGGGRGPGGSSANRGGTGGFNRGNFVGGWHNYNHRDDYGMDNRGYRHRPHGGYHRFGGQSRGGRDFRNERGPDYRNPYSYAQDGYKRTYKGRHN